MQFHEFPIRSMCVFLNDWQLQAFAGKKKKSCKLHLRGLSTPQLICDKNCSFVGADWNVSQKGMVCLSVGLLGFHFMACWWGRHRYGFTPLGRARPRCWQQVLFDVDVPCWVSELASTYDLHYDQRRNACWWMTGDSRQTGEGGCGAEWGRWKKANRWRVAWRQGEM